MSRARLRRPKRKFSFRTITARITIHTRPKLASALQAALAIEARTAPKRFVSVSTIKRGGSVSISLSGRELSHLRAAINSYLRMASAAVGSVSVASARHN